MKNILASIILVASLSYSYAEDVVPTAQTLQTLSIENPSISIGSNYKTVVTITPNGDVILGEGITTDEASIQFWKQLKNYLPSVCEEKK